MTGLRAFAFLAAASFRNRVRLQLGRLRKPRHLIPVLAGLGYFAWLLFGQGGEGRAAIARAADSRGVEALLALIIAARAATWWIFGGDRSALAFSAAEVNFLFSAPIARRDLLQYRLLAVQLRVLFGVLLITLLSWRGVSALALGHALAVWTLLTTLHLHRLGASLARVGAIQHGRVGIRQNAFPLAVAGAGVAALTWAIVGVARDPGFAGDPLRALQRALEAPAAAAAIFPFRLLIRPYFVDGVRPWLAAIWPALLVLVGHYVWVVRSGVAFEDAAVEASAQAAERLAARRGGPGRTGALVRRPRAGGWLPLGPTGAPLGAVVWKNVIAAFRTLPVTPMLVLLATWLVVSLVLGVGPGPGRAARAAGTVAILWGAALLLFGPQLVRNDLRQDLPRLALLRSYPLRGREVVLAQLVAATLVLTALGAPAFVVAYVAYLRDPVAAGGLGARTAWLTAALVTLPMVNALALAVQNAAALLFPGWVRLGAHQRAGGVEAAGQNMVLSLLSLALLGLLLLAPSLTGAMVAWVARPFVGVWALAPAVAVGIAVAGAELWLVVGWLGRLFERTEPSEIHS